MPSIDFTIVGSIVILIGTALTIYGTSKEKNEAKREADSLRTQLSNLKDQNHKLDSSLNSKLDTNAITVNKLKDQLIEKAEENAFLSRKLQVQTDKLVKYQNGGGAVPAMHPFTNGQLPNRIGFEISNQTKLPIKIIRVVIKNITEVQQGKTGHMDLLQMERHSNENTTVLTDVGVLPAHPMISRYVVFSTDVDPSINEVIYTFYVTWEHGYMWGRYSFDRKDGKLVPRKWTENSTNGVQLNDESF